MRSLLSAINFPANLFVIFAKDYERLESGARLPHDNCRVYRQCGETGVVFHFHQTGANFIKGGRRYDIPRKFQHSQAEKAMDYLKNMS